MKQTKVLGSPRTMEDLWDFSGSLRANVLKCNIKFLIECLKYYLCLAQRTVEALTLRLAVEALTLEDVENKFGS